MQAFVQTVIFFIVLSASGLAGESPVPLELNQAVSELKAQFSERLEAIATQFDARVAELKRESKELRTELTSVKVDHGKKISALNEHVRSLQGSLDSARMTAANEPR